MKKTILLLLALLCFAACVPDYPTWSDKGEPQIIKHDIPRRGTYPSSVSILDITYNGSRHEILVLYNTGVTHWPSCKYCEKDKEKGNKEEKQELKQLVIDKTLIEPLKTPTNKQQ